MLLAALLLATQGAAPAAPLPAPVRHAEETRYRLSVGMLGDVGEITVRVTPPTGPHPFARVVGEGRGSILGMGYTTKRIETELDLRTNGARRWTHQRAAAERTITDFAVQAAPGKVSTLRKRTGRPDQPEALDRPTPVMDPVAFLTALRIAPPTGPRTYEVLDGRGLWQLAVGAPRREAGPRPTLRLDGRATPIWWDGTRDTDRSERAFTIWLADDEARTPLRVVMPMGLMMVQAELVSVSRGDAEGRRLSRALNRTAVGRTMMQALKRR